MVGYQNRDHPFSSELPVLLVLSPEEVPAQGILASEGTRELVDGRPRATCLRLSVPPEWWTKKVIFCPFFFAV